MDAPETAGSRSSQNGARTAVVPAVPTADEEGIATLPNSTSPELEPSTSAPLLPTLAVVNAVPLKLKEKGSVMLFSESSLIAPTEVPVELISTNAVLHAVFIVY